jgi:hypothetical protein
MQLQWLIPCGAMRSQPFDERRKHRFAAVEWRGVAGKGGQPGCTANSKRTRVRGVKGIDEDARLNRALWRMALALRDGNLTLGQPVQP